MMHQPSWIELAVFVSLVWMLKWMQFNQDTPNCPKMAVFFIGFCLLLLLGVYFFPMQIENLIWQYPVN